MRRIEVTASTLGQANPSQVTASKPYRWRGNPDWEPGHPAYREPAKPALTAGGAAIKNIRETRIAAFGEALRDLGYQNPRNASKAAVIEAGVRVGVGEKTARKYRAALLGGRQGGSDD